MLRPLLSISAGKSRDTPPPPPLHVLRTDPPRAVLLEDAGASWLLTHEKEKNLGIKGYRLTLFSCPPHGGTPEGMRRMFSASHHKPTDV